MFFEFTYLFIFSLAIIGAIFISLICIRQIDIKCLIAYSSVAHIGPVLASILSFV
jgi:NADH-ubiquinone oxidoreductase chain 4